MSQVSGLYEDAIKAALEKGKQAWEVYKTMRKPEEKKPVKEQPKEAVKTPADALRDMARDAMREGAKEGVKTSVSPWVWIALGYLLLTRMR